jgi:hypothetical protein
MTDDDRERVGTFSTMGRHLALHARVADGLEEYTESRVVSLRLMRVVGDASDDLLRDLGSHVEEWLLAFDPDDDEAWPRFLEYDHGGLFVRVEAVGPTPAQPLPAGFRRPLVSNPYRPVVDDAAADDVTPA